MPPRAPEPSPRTAQERILIHVTGDPASAALIRRGRRVADYLGAECFAVAVLPTKTRLKPEGREKIDRHLEFACNMQIETRSLEGNSAAETLVEFARRNRVTQIFLSHPSHRPWLSPLARSLDQEVVHLARDIRVVIVADRQRSRKARSKSSSNSMPSQDATSAPA